MLDFDVQKKAEQMSLARLKAWIVCEALREETVSAAVGIY